MIARWGGRDAVGKGLVPAEVEAEPAAGPVENRWARGVDGVAPGRRVKTGCRVPLGGWGGLRGRVGLGGR